MVWVTISWYQDGGPTLLQSKYVSDGWVLFKNDVILLMGGWKEHFPVLPRGETDENSSFRLKLLNTGNIQGKLRVKVLVSSFVDDFQILKSPMHWSFVCSGTKLLHSKYHNGSYIESLFGSFIQGTCLRSRPVWIGFSWVGIRFENLFHCSRDMLLMKELCWMMMYGGGTF